MNTDREFLEMAARAAGLSIDRSEFNGGGLGNNGFDAAGNAVLDWHNGVRWNPLQDDGDALRLANRLKLNVMHGDYSVGVNDERDVDEGAPLKYGSAEERDRVTRRLIVRAAAEIGKAMP